MLNLRNHKDIRLTVKPELLKKWIAQPNFHSHRVITDELAMVHMNKTHIKWDKPTYVGYTILELSKAHMYWFHYDVILARYGRNAKLLFTDTDSLCYELKTKDFYADIEEDAVHYDTGDYPIGHKCRSTTNARVLGKFKDECNGKQPLEFVGLRAKMYSLLMPDGKQKATAKGIKQSYAKKKLVHSAYLDCVENHVNTTASYYEIRSRNHEIKTTLVRKSALCSFDDKRYLLPNGVDTLAHGHYKTRVE